MMITERITTFGMSETSLKNGFANGVQRSDVWGFTHNSRINQEMFISDEGVRNLPNKLILSISCAATKYVLLCVVSCELCVCPQFLI